MNDQNYIHVTCNADPETFSAEQRGVYVAAYRAPTDSIPMVRKFHGLVNASRYIHLNYPGAFVIWPNGNIEHLPEATQ